MAATAFMTGLQIIGSVSDAENQKEMGNYQNEQYQQNAKNAERDARLAEKRGEEQAINQGKQVNQVVGQQKVGYAASGVDVSSGSAAAVTAETYKIGFEDMSTIKNNAYLEAMGFRQQAANYRTAGAQALKGAQNSANASILRGGLAVADTLYKNGYFKGTTGEVATTKGTKVSGSSYSDVSNIG